jgi:signal transduction histidine kinase
MSILHLILLSAAAAPFILATWAAFLHWRPPFADIDTMGTAPRLIRTRFEAETMDLSDVLRSMADSLEPLARPRFVRILLAVGPGHMVHADRDALNTMLRETIGTAIRAAPGGQVLISVRTLGTQTHIVVTDDGANADQKLRETLGRAAGELIALQGGTLAIEARAGRGTSVTLRLPLSASQSAGLTAASVDELPQSTEGLILAS